jgi:hypothetical protein
LKAPIHDVRPDLNRCYSWDFTAPGYATMRVASLVLLALIASHATAQAWCEDDMKQVRLKVERLQKTNLSAQTAAAAKELHRYDERRMSADEVDCRNAIARVERALRASPPAAADPGLKPGEPAAPLNEPAKSAEEQAKE